jgi:hypothetical protein
MKRGLILLAAVAPTLALAQTIERPKTLSSEAAATAFAVQAPDEGSPFFSDREAARALTQQEAAGYVAPGEVAEFPRSKNSPNSAGAMFTSFFTDMFSSVKFGSLRAEPFTETLTVTPQDFSLQDRRDVETTYTVVNNTGKMVRLAFPTSQRIDIITRDASGAEIDKWSDDRAFKPQDGIVIINPKERIEYKESIPTRDMKVGESYTIQADVVGYPDYTTTQTVSPTP